MQLVVQDEKTSKMAVDSTIVVIKKMVAAGGIGL